MAILAKRGGREPAAKQTSLPRHEHIPKAILRVVC